MSETTSTAAAPEPLQCSYRLSGGVAVVDVLGEVDLFSCGLLRDQLQRALTDDFRRGLVVNLAGMAFIDSAGLGVLVGVWRRAQTGPGLLALAAPQRQARTVFETTGLAGVFPVYDTEAQAVQACRQPPGG
jgi:anti-anti-sigma factor